MPVATTAELLLARAEDDAPGLLFENRSWTWREVVAHCTMADGSSFVSATPKERVAGMFVAMLLSPHFLLTK